MRRLAAYLLIGFGVSLWGSALSLAAERLPIVFAHGLGVPSETYETVIPIRAVLRKLGYQGFVARTPVSGSLEERARILAAEVLRLVPEGKFHLVGHSMGGIDARLAIHEHGLAERCVSLTTLASPHRGSPMADFVISAVDDVSRVGGGVAAQALRLFGGEIAAARDLTIDRMEKFNLRVTDDPRVRYFSFAFYIPEPAMKHSRVPWLWALHDLMKGFGFPRNDALVSVESASWGELLEVLPGDHYSETGPIPFEGGEDYQEILAKVVRNLEKSAQFSP